MPCIPSFHAIALALPLLLLRIELSAAEPAVRLECRINETRASLVAVEESRLWVEANGDRVAVPTQAEWELSGDLLGNASIARWSPTYRIQRVPVAETGLTPGEPFRAIVTVLNQEIVPPGREEVENPLLNDWPDGGATTSVVVAAWLHEGRVRQVVVGIVPPTKKGGRFRLDLLFRLSADEKRGQPLLLLWQRGAFVAPAPLFADLATREAALAVLLDDDVRLTQALAAGARLDQVSRTGVNLGGLAAEAGARRVLPLLQKYRPRILFEKDRTGYSPLRLAAAKARRETLRDLLAAPGVKAAFKSQLPRVLQTVVSNGHTEILEELLQAFPQRDSTTLFSKSVELALMNGYPDLAARLVVAGAPFNPTRDEAGAMLGERLRASDWTAAQFLLAHKANPNIETHAHTALHWAARRGSAELAEALLAAGARANRAGYDDITPLMVAAEGANAAFAAVLLRAGSRVNAASWDQVTALHLAASANAAEVVKLLLHYGAGFNERTASKYSALDIALLVGAGDAARVLCAAGARIDLQSPRAGEMLECALRNDIPEPVAAAITDGWKPNTMVAPPWPALCLARILHAERCEALLIAAGSDASAPQPCPVVRPSEVDQPLELLHAVTPRDPRRSEEVFAAGSVEIDFIVDTDGQPRFPRILKSPDPRLGIAVLQALPKWRFAAPTRDGKPVAVRATIPINFPSSAERLSEMTLLATPPVVLRSVEGFVPTGMKLTADKAIVVVSLLVRWDGTITEPYVVSTPDPALNSAALASAKKWRFKAAQSVDRPVDMRTEIEVVFLR